jgi:basic membrane protein A
MIVYQSATDESDKAFVEAALAGARRARDQLGITFEEYRTSPDEDSQQALQALAKKGYSPIVALGYQQVLPVHNLAERFRKTRFCVIDGLVPPLYPNVQSIIFKDHEGAFLVGFIAALTSETGMIGFIGGMDVPIIRNFAMGYKQGAEFAKSDIRVVSDMLGDTDAAWSSPEEAHALAQKQYESGADVIFAAAGGSGLGVLRAAKDMKKLAIGVDTNQNGLFPGYVLTSMVKRVDIAVFETLKATHSGEWQPGIRMLGLKDGALDFTVDQHNKNLLSASTVDKTTAAKERIINGLIDVKSYSVR